VSLGTRFDVPEPNTTKCPSALIEGMEELKLPSVPTAVTEARSVLGIQGVSAPRQVSRTNMSIKPLVSPETRFCASELNATKRPLALIEGSPLAALPGVLEFEAETSVVVGVHPIGAPAQVSRTKTLSTPCGIVPDTRFEANEANAMYRPSALIDGNALPSLLCTSPGPTETRAVLGEHPVAAPKHVSRTKTSMNVVVSFGVRFFAAELNAMYRPFALIAGKLLTSFPCEPSEAMDARIVLGVQLVGAPLQVSRKKTSVAKLVSLAARLVALESKTTNRPSALMDGSKLLPFDWVPSDATETRIVVGVQTD
jgi:hypothetical protein